MADWTITQEDFNRLLAWLDPDRNRAGEHYERIRRKLILTFASRGRVYPEEMADDCINRVIRKLPEIEEQYQGDPENYFWGMVRFVDLEWLRKEQPYEIPPPKGTSTEDEESLACLDQCLNRLPESIRGLALDYYQHDRKAKIDHRAALAGKLGIGANALRIRAHRIRQHLEKCVLECLRETGLAWES